MDQKIELIRMSNSVNTETFEMPAQLISDDVFENAKKQIKKIEAYKTPRDKLVCIVNTCKLVAGVFR